MLNWVIPFNIFCLLDNNNYHFESPAFECLLAADAMDAIQLTHATAFSELKQFSTAHPGWLFGHLNYPSIKKDASYFPDGFFFIPRYIIRLSKESVSIEAQGTSPEKIFEEIEAQSDEIGSVKKSTIAIKNKTSEKEYYQKLTSIKQHLQRGDCYELNFCQEFFAENVTLDPLAVFYTLNKISPNPFAAFYKIQDKYCACASPERFIKKSGTTIISQPIKGTSKRYSADLIKDQESKAYLQTSQKEKSENVMIVDLVRNDLSKICTEGSVAVKELCGIYSFPQVHQMISTITGTVHYDAHWTDIIEACYPMGSMTGAPKKRVMELIEQYEDTPRGLFSGTIGYVTPEGDFDFNVVIRSLFYNETAKQLSFKAGGGITHLSDIEKEYQESLIKVAAIKSILEE